MKRVIRTTAIAIVFLAIGTFAMIETFGQGPGASINKTSESSFEEGETETIFNTTDSLESKFSSSTLKAEEEAGQVSKKECPDRETMLGSPILSIECYLYEEYFQEAYELYPNIPRGVLEAVASQNRGLIHITEDDYFGEWDPHHDAPRTYTVMGHHAVEGYEPNLVSSLRITSEASGYSVSDILSDPYISIISYAKALDLGFSNRDTLENAWSALFQAAYSLHSWQFTEYSKESFYEVLYGSLTSPQYGEWFRFTPYKIPKDVLQAHHSMSFNLKLGPSGCSGSSVEDAVVQYPSCNYGARPTNAIIDKIAIHTIEGTASVGVNTFLSCVNGVSAHYVVGRYLHPVNDPNKIVRGLCEEDNGYHVQNHNSTSIGIEHAGNANNTLFTSLFYEESADLVSDIASRYPDIDPLSAYTGPAHGVTTLLPGCIDIKGHQHFDISQNVASYKYDPGDTWDWFYYYGLINDNPIQTNHTASSGSFFDPGGSVGDYSPLENRVYVVDPGVTNVTLDIASFDVSPGDYVWIYDKPNPNIEPNPHNNMTDLGIGTNAPSDVPVANFYTGTIVGLSQTTFTSSNGGFYIVFRSDCSSQGSGFQINWNTGVSTPCVNTYEPNNSSSQTHVLDLVGSGVPFVQELNACVDGSSDDDWYEVLLLEPGMMTITLSDDAPYDLNMSSNPSVNVVTLGNNDKQLTFCHNGISCFSLRIRVWNPGIFSNQVSDYSLTFDWNTNISCIPDNLASSPSTPKLGSTGLVISGVTTDCLTQSIGASVSGGSGSYDWYVNGIYVGPGTNLQETVGSSGTHNILAIDQNNPCLTAWDDVVVPSGTAAPSITPSTATIAPSGSVQLFASGGSSYSWSPATGLSNASVWNPIASPTVTTTYVVSVDDGLGCLSTENVVVTVSGVNSGPPTNNNPCNASILLVGISSCSFTTGTNSGATNSGVVVDPLCASTSLSNNPTGNYAGGDVWYKVLVPSSGMVIIQTQQQSSLNDAVIAAYTGSCGNLNMIACSDDQSASNYMPLMTLNNLTPNTWVYIRVWEFGNNTFGDFGICATTTGSGGGTSGPDLSVTSFSINNNTVDQGDNVTVNFTVQNIGNQTSPACFYMCALADAFEASWTTGGLMSFAAIPTLAPGASQSYSLSLTIPNVSDGTYYLVIGADEPLDNINEGNEINNLAGSVITIGNVIPQGVDLDVTTRYLSQTSGLQPGLVWEVGLEIENDGTEDAIGTTALIVLSEDSDYDPGIDIFVWQFNTADLDPGEEDYDEKRVTFPMVPHAGTWRVLFIADANHQIAEIDEANNISTRTISVSTITPATADYVTTINDLRDKTTGLYLSNNEIPSGHELEILTGTTNQGLIRPSVSARTNFIVSPLPYLVGMQCRIGNNTHSNAGIAVGATDNASPDDYLRGVQVGTNYIIVRTDYQEDIYEGVLGEGNNFSAYPIFVTHSGPVADLVPRIISIVPFNNALGDSIIVTTRVYNYGDTTAWDFLLRHWVSIDDKFDGRYIDGRLEQTLLRIDSLAPGDSIDVTRHMAIDNDFSAPDLINHVGQYYILAVVDEMCEDVIEMSVLNNVSSIPISISDISCYVNMRWDYDTSMVIIPWDQTHVDWVYFESPEDCDYVITSSPWILFPFTMTISGETAEYPAFDENLTGLDRTGCIYGGLEDSMCFIQKAAPSITLPVTWISIDAYEFEGNGLVYWRVGVEYNVDHYSVERSFDGINFYQVGTTNPFNQSNSTYRFSDELHDHTVYYRVVAIDYDGTRDKSDIVSLVGYRPYEETYNLTRMNNEYQIESFSQIEYKVYSILGQQMQSVACGPGETCTIRMEQSGMYMLVITIYGEQYVEKLIF